MVARGVEAWQQANGHVALVGRADCRMMEAARTFAHGDGLSSFQQNFELFLSIRGGGVSRSLSFSCAVRYRLARGGQFRTAKKLALVAAAHNPL